MTILLSSPAFIEKQTLAPYRLRRHADYQRVYQASRKYHSASLSYFLRVRSPDEQPAIAGPRIGLTVGRVMGKAVARNRMKRRMREAIRLNLKLLLAAPGPERALDLVLHPRKSVATMDFALLSRELADLFALVLVKARKPDPPPPPRRPASASRGKGPPSPAQPKQCTQAAR